MRKVYVLVALTIFSAAMSTRLPRKLTTDPPCVGFSCNGKLKNQNHFPFPPCSQECPDREIQSQRRPGSAACGNVFVTIVEAQNLNAQDGKATPDAGIAKWSDAYVRVQVGIPGFWSTRETGRIGNENKHWLGKKNVYGMASFR